MPAALLPMWQGYYYGSSMARLFDLMPLGLNVLSRIPLSVVSDSVCISPYSLRPQKYSGYLYFCSSQLSTGTG